MSVFYIFPVEFHRGRSESASPESPEEARHGTARPQAPPAQRKKKKREGWMGRERGGWGLLRPNQGAGVCVVAAIG